ncbi:hypothetical protein BDC45DRAFT_569273 [Circinella umbellata]|nr:hypothetical protein BDC45DRAFT_569273 [Circinella umbellata]
MGDGSSSNAFLRNLSQKKYSWMQSSSTDQPNSPSSSSSSVSATSIQPNDNNTNGISSTKTPSPKSTSSKEPTDNHKRQATTMVDDANNSSYRSPKKPRQEQLDRKSLPISNIATTAIKTTTTTTPVTTTKADAVTTPTTMKNKDNNNNNNSNEKSFSAVPVTNNSNKKVSNMSNGATQHHPQQQQQQRNNNKSNASRTPSPKPQQEPEEEDQVQKKKQPRFKYTTFPVKGFTILPTRNVTSGYDKTDATYFPGNKMGSEAIAPNPDEEWIDTIVIHPGSRNLRIGRSSEAFPKTVPHVIARHMKTKHNNPTPSSIETEKDVVETADVVVQQKKQEENNNDNEDSDEDEKEDKMDLDDEDDESPLSSPEDDIDLDDGFKRRTSVSINNNNNNGSAYNRDDALREIKNELKWRMKAAKRRAVPNAEGQVIGFNTQAYQETIPDHNDPYKVEWTEVDKVHKPEYFVGDKALNLPIADNPEYRLMYPWTYGTFNSQDYDSIEHVLGDLQTIWTEAIQSELGIEETTFEDYNVVLVIPDLFNRRYTCELITMLLRYMKFRGVLVQQESSCATFGAGVSSACVVDIGSQKTSVACIEDGVCFTDSRMTIAIGGDDITKTFASFLLANRFPYADINLSRSYDWRLAQELKEKWCTMNEADISVQVYDFFVRAPKKTTKKFQCKVYDEVFLAPLCLVYPAILHAEEKTEHTKVWASTSVIDDIADETHALQNTVPTVWQPQQSLQRVQQKQQQNEISSTPNTNNNNNSTPQPTTITSITTTVTEKSNNYDVYPIDIAIAESIRSASGSSDERLKRFFTNIILVGGGGMISNFNRVLEDRILSTFIARRSAIERVEVLPAPRELDPRLLMWKGGSVLSKLDTAKEMWIGQEEWNNMGARCLRDRALFV